MNRYVLDPSARPLDGGRPSRRFAAVAVPALGQGAEVLGGLVDGEPPLPGRASSPNGWWTPAPSTPSRRRSLPLDDVTVVIPVKDRRCGWSPASTRERIIVVDDAPVRPVSMPA